MNILQSRPVVKVEVYHNPEHWNSTCQATIPECYEANVININELLEAESYEHFFLYDVGETKKEAIDNLKSQLKELFPNGGVIRII